jgi:large subunit ribosomal protein L30
MLRIKLVRSPIGNNKRNRATVTALGLRKINQVVEKPDTPSIRGMIQKVRHMVQVEAVEQAPAENKPKRAPKPKAEAAPAEVETSQTEETPELAEVKE